MQNIKHFVLRNLYLLLFLLLYYNIWKMHLRKDRFILPEILMVIAHHRGYVVGAESLRLLVIASTARMPFLPNIGPQYMSTTVRSIPA